MGACDIAVRDDNSALEGTATDMVEAFWEVGEWGPLGPTSYCAGYRFRMAGGIICKVELAAAIAEAAILANSALAMMVTADGYISSSLSGVADSKSKVEPIDELIAQLLSVENLRLNEIAAVDLSSLLERLERSVDLVREVMERSRIGIS